MTEFDYWVASIQRVVTVIKIRCPELSTEETLALAAQCVKAVLAVPQERTR